MPRGLALYVDVSEVLESIERMKNTFSEDNAKRILHDTIVDTGKKSQSLIANVVTKDFAVTKRWARKHVLYMKQTGPLSWEIPLSGARGLIGTTFGMRATLISRKKGASKRRRVKSAQIKRGVWSNLPDVTPHQGGNIIFPVGKKIAATRSERKKLVRVVGKSLPQMAVTSPTSEKLDKELGKYMLKRLENHINRAMKNWA